MLTNPTSDCAGILIVHTGKLAQESPGPHRDHSTLGPLDETRSRRPMRVHMTKYLDHAGPSRTHVGRLETRSIQTECVTNLLRIIEQDEAKAYAHTTTGSFTKNAFTE